MHSTAIHTGVKRLYKRFSVREKFLLLFFLVVLLAIWTSSLLARVDDWNQRRQEALVERNTQDQWLERADSYTEQLTEALTRVDPEKTYSGSRLSGRIDNLLRKTELAQSADIDPVRSREGEIFNDHNLRARLNRIAISDLIALNKLLRQESPYITIQHVRLDANNRNPNQLNVRLEINSFDLRNSILEN
ncbi:MAG: hypothetical protein ACLFUF_02100 [Opitutales bacterium]